MNLVSKYASMVKFAHTVFAMPFALIGYVYALTSTATPFDWVLLVKILFCMVFARNTAMGFNRLIDRAIDAKNPRTVSREIPSGKISVTSARWFVAVNAIGFLVAAALINKLTLMLAPVALFVVMGYSYCKRFTAWSHIVLGVALAIAPAGAYIAVTGSIGIVPVLLAGLVITWVSGFDIIYSLQDAEFDRANGLHSVPARFSTRGAIIISIILHLVSVYAVWVIGIFYGGGKLYWTGTALFCLVLVYQHIMARPSNLDRIGATFTLVNGVASICYAAFFVADLLV